MNNNLISLGGFEVTRTRAQDLHGLLPLNDGKQRSLFFANTNFIVKCQPLREHMHNAIIVNDGIGVDIATWLIHREKFQENLNGTDFIPAYLHARRDQARVFLYGAKPGIAQRAAQTLREQFQVNVVGTCDGYAQAKNQDQLIANINSLGANVVLVALGNPAQEQWIINNQSKLSASVFIGVGALLDFLAGDKPRAPKLVQKLRLEWFYRMCLEPTRLVRRYTLDIAVFLRLCIKSEKAKRRLGLISDNG